MHLAERIPRRGFLSLAGRLSALGLVCLGLPVRGASRATNDPRGAAAPQEAIDLGTVECAHFRARVGDAFLVRDRLGNLSTLTLGEARELPRYAPELGRTPFSVLFLGSERGPLVQDTYRVSHPALGELRLLLVPVVPDGPGRPYEAIFS